jgi:poly(A) polymerase Pap1
MAVNHVFNPKVYCKMKLHRMQLVSLKSLMSSMCSFATNVAHMWVIPHVHSIAILLMFLALNGV